MLRDLPPLCAYLCACVALLVGCGSGNSGDANVERDIRRGLAQMQSVRDRKALEAKLTAVVAGLRSETPSTDSKRRARALAIAGFEAKLKSVAADREFYENDSGEVAEATKDAARAGAYQKRAADLLGAAERALGS
jgi:hypothetical protein